MKSKWSKRITPWALLSLSFMLASSVALADPDGKRRDGPYPMVGTFKTAAHNRAPITVTGTAPSGRRPALELSSPSRGKLKVNVNSWNIGLNHPGVTYEIKGRANGQRVRLSMRMVNTNGVGSRQVMSLRPKGFSAGARAMRKHLGMRPWNFLGTKHFSRTSKLAR